MCRKKILMVGTSFETMGGISTVVNSYRLSGLFDRRLVTYITTHSDGSAIKKLFISVFSLVNYVFCLFFGSYDLIHIHVSSRASFWRKALFILMAKIFKKKIIFHLHGSEFRQFFDDELSPFSRRIALFIINKPDVILALSVSWGEWLNSRVSGPKVIILENSIVPSLLSERLTKNQGQILFLGRIGERKGFWDLLAALKQLVDKGYEFKLLAGGDGEVEKAKSLVIDYGLQDKVEFLGWVRSKQKLELLASSSIFLLPSYNEGMPMSVLEALSAGLPVISTNVGGIPEQVADGVEGYVIAPGDVAALTQSLMMLLDSSDLQERMSRACVEKFERCFSTDVVLPKLEKIYDDLLSQP